MTATEQKILLVMSQPFRIWAQTRGQTHLGGACIATAVAGAHILNKRKFMADNGL